MNRPALTALRDLLLGLDTAPMRDADGEPIAFDINVTVSTDDDDDGCGTAACALGHAALDPTLSAATGLSPGDSQCSLRRNGEDMGYGRAAMAAFDLSYDDAMEIFSPGRYDRARVAPSEVADRIDELLETA